MAGHDPEPTIAGLLRHREHQGRLPDPCIPTHEKGLGYARDRPRKCQIGLFEFTGPPE
jgi:hypothetical protein